MTEIESSNFDLAVIGGGPGGYTAAFRASDLGLRVALVERYATLGGVCLNVGCVPSKALLHVAQLVTETKHFSQMGVLLGAVAPDLESLQTWKSSVVEKLTSGLAGLAKRRKIQVFQGKAAFLSPNEISVATDATLEKVLPEKISFKQAIIATGSSAIQLPFLPKDARIWGATQALTTPSIPKRLLVIGGGVIGLEMATVYQALGSEVTVVELMDSLIPGVDKGTVRQLQLKLKKEFQLFLGTKVTSVVANEASLMVEVENKKGMSSIETDNILVAVGRTPNSQELGLERAGVNIDERGSITVDEQQRTNVSHLFAIGDVTPGPMLAHKAATEGRVAAEVCAGLGSKRNNRCIPSVAYTTPELAVVGLSEASAQAAGYEVQVGKFPFAANARAMTLENTVGSTKLIFDKVSQRILGAEIVGPNAGELISELALAIQSELTVEQLTSTIHPHPSLSESVLAAAEVFEGTITDLFIPKR